MRHDFTPDEYGHCCTVCWASYHCGACGDGSSMQGHLVNDGDGWYFHCEEPERWERQRTALMKRMNRERLH